MRVSALLFGFVFTSSTVRKRRISCAGNVQHCRNSIAAVSPEEGTNPGSDPTLNHSNYSYVVYSPKSRYAIRLRHVFDGADATLETVQNFEFKGQVPAIMFDIDNTLAYTGKDGKGHKGSARGETGNQNGLKVKPRLRKVLVSFI